MLQTILYIILSYFALGAVITHIHLHYVKKDPRAIKQLKDKAELSGYSFDKVYKGFAIFTLFTWIMNIHNIIFHTIKIRREIKVKKDLLSKMSEIYKDEDKKDLAKALDNSESIFIERTPENEEFIKNTMKELMQLELEVKLISFEMNQAKKEKNEEKVKELKLQAEEKMAKVMEIVKSLAAKSAK